VDQTTAARAEEVNQGEAMKNTLTLLTTLLLTPLAALHATRNLPGVPGFGILRAGSFQALETFGATASNDWN
jgi:hypothetical protein